MSEREKKFEGEHEPEQVVDESPEFFGGEQDINDNLKFDNEADAKEVLDSVTPMLPSVDTMFHSWEGRATKPPTESSTDVHIGVLQLIEFAGDDSNDFRVATNNLPPNR